MMGKRGFGQRRTVVQLGSEERKQPTYGFGYRPPQDGENAKPEGALTALSGLMSQYAENENDNEDDFVDDSEVVDVPVVKASASAKSASDSNGKGNTSMPLKKFVASSDPPLGNLSPGPPKTIEPAVGKEPVSQEAAASSSASEQGVEVSTDSEKKEWPKDEIDLKLRDFLAEIESIDTDDPPPGESVTTDSATNSTVDAGGQATTTSGVNKVIGSAGSGSTESSIGTDSGSVGSATGTVGTDKITVGTAKGSQNERKKRERKRSDESDGEGRSSEEERLKQIPRPVEPEAPTTPWQHCLDDDTQCYYYWSMETNEVTWEIPAEYSQYLLRCKHYEEQLAKYETELAAWKKLQRRVKKKKHHKRSKYRETNSAELWTSENKDSAQTSENVGSTVTRPPNEAAKTFYGPVLPSTVQTRQNVAVEGKVEVQDRRVRFVSYDSDTMTEDDGNSVDAVKVSHSGSIVATKTFNSDNCVKTKTSQSGSTAGAKTSLGSKKIKTSAKSKTAEKKNSSRESSTEKLDTSDDLNREGVMNNMCELRDGKDLVSNKAAAEEDFDVDDIDRELEQALDRGHGKAVKASAAGENSEKPLMMSSHDDAQQINDPQAYRITDDDIKLRTSILTQISELSTDILTRLEDAGAYRTDIDRLYSLLIQTQTRIQDWKAGGLNTEYLLRQLVETSAELARCQDLPPLAQRQAAVPTDQMIDESECRYLAEWDSASERYLYVNLTTGTASWEIPPMGSSVMHGSSVISTVRTEVEQDSSLPMEMNYNASSTLPASHSQQFDADLQSLALPICVSNDIFTLVEKTPPPPPPSPPPVEADTPTSYAENQEISHMSSLDMDARSSANQNAELEKGVTSISANQSVPFERSTANHNDSLEKGVTVTPFSHPPLFITELSATATNAGVTVVATPVISSSNVANRNAMGSGEDNLAVHQGASVSRSAMGGLIAYEASDDSNDDDDDYTHLDEQQQGSLHDLAGEQQQQYSLPDNTREQQQHISAVRRIDKAFEEVSHNLDGKGTDVNVDKEMEIERGDKIDEFRPAVGLSGGEGTSENLEEMGDELEGADTDLESGDYEIGAPREQETGIFSEVAASASNENFVPGDGNTAPPGDKGSIEADGIQPVIAGGSGGSDGLQQNLVAKEKKSGGKEKSKKREKGTELSVGGIKKKKITGLVEKWQKVQKEVNESIEKQQQHQQLLKQQLELEAAKLKQEREAAARRKQLDS